MKVDRRRFLGHSTLVLSPLFPFGMQFPQNVSAISGKVRYTIEEVGPLEGDDSSLAFAVSPHGWVTGTSNNSVTGASSVFRYKKGKIRSPKIKTKTSIGWSVNRSTQIAGFAGTDDGITTSFIWTGSDIEFLSTLGGTSCQAFGINDDGIVVGGSQFDESGTYVACKWSEGKVSALSSSIGASLASAINNSGQIVGSASSNPDPAAAGNHATLWDGDEAIDLGTIAGNTSLGRSINDNGLIVGHSTTTNDGQFGASGTHAFMWKNGSMTDLGTLPGGTTSFAWNVNRDGLISGTADNPDTSADSRSKTRAVLWAETEIIDLNSYLPEDSGWVLTGAYGVNDAGQIAGNGTFAGQTRGFLLTPETE